MLFLGVRSSQYINYFIHRANALWRSALVAAQNIPVEVMIGTIYFAMGIIM